MNLDENVSSSAVIRNQLKVLSVAEGFFQSAVLFALLKLQVFERIGDKTKPLEDLAAESNAHPETLARLLNAGVVLQLLESGDGIHYRIHSSCRSELLPSAGENYLGNWIRNLDFFRQALERLDEAVLTSSPTVDPNRFLGGDKEQTREYELAMHNYASLRGMELAHFLDTSGCETLLDIGCGPGTYAFHLGMRNPNLQLFLLDFPAVLEVTREVRDRYAIGNEVHYLPQDALKDEIPGSYDIILLSNVMHMLGEKAKRKLVSRLYRSVNPHGSLVIQAQFLKDDRMGERWPVLLDLIQLCITSDGRNQSVGETRHWMEEAGFKNIEYCPMTLLNTNSYLRGYRN
jgi:SAM-dependent methyltransferase